MVMDARGSTNARGIANTNGMLSTPKRPNDGPQLEQDVGHSAERPPMSKTPVTALSDRPVSKTPVVALSDHLTRPPQVPLTRHPSGPVAALQDKIRSSPATADNRRRRRLRRPP